MSDYPPKVLQRFRRLGQVNATGLPVTVGAGALASLTFSFAGILTDIAKLSHTRIRVSVYGAVFTTDSGGQTKISLESATLYTAQQNIAAPLFSGSALAALNAGSLQGGFTFDTDDLQIQPIAATPPTDITGIVTVMNSDTGGHNITAATLTLLIEGTQYAELLLPTVT